ncbi:SubName: Full=Uncharacterized protein {ECO:0000313/EMBL:CCA69077.1} [Serendipita indica DSM 11827]|nr:SubName: Full=Uncharacterized protein {ECO:0000313/EMBL:CCA69077.1} [Serendipita indica DSM 11827]
MLHPTFAAYPGPLRNGGPADDSDEDTPLQGRAYARTPFPTQRMLGSPPEDTDSDVVVPGGRPRSYSNPTPSPFVNGNPGSAFGSPEYELGQVERGPYNPPQPGVMPAKSALRQSRRATMDQLRGGLPTIIGSPSVPGLPPDALFPNGQPVPPGYPVQQQRMGSVRGTPYVLRPGGMPTPMMHPQQQTPRVMSPMGSGMFPTPGPPQMIPIPTSGRPMHQMFPATPLPPGIGPYGKPPSQPPVSLSGMRTPMPAMGARPIPHVPGGHSVPGAMSMPVLPQQWPASAQPDRRRRRRHRRRRGNEDDDGSDSSASSRQEHHNPLPEPPRILPMPDVSPDGSIRVDSPPATNPFGKPEPPPKPPPNPLPVPPKSIIAEKNASAELEAANEAVKRAKEQTELAKAKAIQRLEAEAWREAGVPIGGDEENPVVPLIPGVTAPGVLPTAAEPPVTRKKARPTTIKKGEMVMSNVKTRKRGEESEEEEEEQEEEKPHGTIASGIGSLFKRISTRHRPEAPNGPPPPVAPKPPPKRGSKQPPPRPPPLPTHNSFDMPPNEPIIPRGTKRSTIDAPFRSQVITAGPTPTAQGFPANGQPMSFQAKPGMQHQPIYDPSTQEWYDPTSGQWWNPNTRKYYHKRAATVAPYVSGVKGEKEKGGGGLMSMLKRWTTNTAPDDQPRPITAQLIMPGSQRDGAPQQPIVVLPDHPHSGRQRRRTVSAGESGMPISWYGSRQRRQSGRTSTQTHQRPQIPPWGYGPHATPLDGQTGLPTDMMMGGPPGHVGQGNIYFSRKKDPYGAFRLDADYPVSWGGLEAPALNWFESGKFENVTTGLGSLGMGTGWTRPSTQAGDVTGRGSSGKRGAKRLLRGFLGGKKSEEGLKNSRMEYARARTEYSEMVLRARGAREVDRLVSQFTLEGAQREDWAQVYRPKLDEINFLKFQQNEVLLNMLLGTGNATIIFNSENAELGDGGHVNGATGHGRNELGHSLMRVREILLDRYAGDEEEGA